MIEWRSFLLFGDASRLAFPSVVLMRDTTQVAIQAAPRSHELALFNKNKIKN